MQIKLHLVADLVLSSDITKEAEEILQQVVTESNTQHFLRGVPKDADPKEVGRITDWNVSGKVLNVTCESGSYTRVHDALFRFRKQIAAQLGRQRIGVRSIEISSFLLTLSGEDCSLLKIPKLPFLQVLSADTDEMVLSLDISATDCENKVPDRVIRLIEEKNAQDAYGGKTEHWELIFESETKKKYSTLDPTAEMVKRKWIKHGISRGQWCHGPQSVRLFRAFEQIVLTEIIRPLKFSEMIFPKVVPWDVWKRSGHCKGVYPEIYYVSTPKSRDPEYWEEVIDYYKVTGQVPIEMIRERIDGPIGGMCYAQCPPFWPFLQGETLANDCLPIRVFDRSGTSHRYESGGIHGIERVDEFHRIEILWLGTVEQTIKTADLLAEAYHHVFEDLLELEWRAARVTPWFMAQEGMVGTAETNGKGGNRIGTTDYEALLPYNDTWLEFQNVSINADKYPKGFNVKIQSGEECWSGCSGIGLERWTASFLAQKGLDYENWPEPVQKLAGEPVDVIKTL
ncbi:MAG: serine--tRNA ligase [Methanospirillaceae archaeon]|nr:serine--tRNA ligase [Methanospirillaceae archaeon]